MFVTGFSRFFCYFLYDFYLKSVSLKFENGQTDLAIDKAFDVEIFLGAQGKIKR